MNELPDEEYKELIRKSLTCNNSIYDLNIIVFGETRRRPHVHYNWHRQRRRKIVYKVYK
jgi:hypothetical protein